MFIIIIIKIKGYLNQGLVKSGLFLIKIKWLLSQIHKRHKLQAF